MKVAWERLWQIEPVLFNPNLIELCDEAIRETCGTSPSPAVRPVARRRRSCARRRADRDDVRAKPARHQPQQNRGHEGRTSGTLRDGVRPAGQESHGVGGGETVTANFSRASHNIEAPGKMMLGPAVPFANASERDFHRQPHCLAEQQRAGKDRQHDFPMRPFRKQDG